MNRACIAVLVTLGLSFILAASGCGERPGPVAVDVATRVQAASAPIALPFSFEFVDLNPCSGLDHTVTITGTAWIHEHDGRVVVREERTISTSSGFEGRGMTTIVDNGNILKVTVNDMLTHPSGDRIRPHFVFVFDISSSSVQVFQGAVTCVRA